MAQSGNDSVLCALPGFAQPQVYLYCDAGHLIVTDSVTRVVGLVLTRADCYMYCKGCSANCKVHPMTADHLSRIHRYANAGSAWSVYVSTSKAYTPHGDAPSISSTSVRAALTSAEQHEILYRAADIRFYCTMMRYIESRVQQAMRNAYDGITISQTQMLEVIDDSAGWLEGSAFVAFRDDCTKEWDSRGFKVEWCEKPSVGGDGCLLRLIRKCSLFVGPQYSLDDGTVDRC
jgi:hypothetical protein